MAPAGFECSLRVSGTATASWASCSSPQLYTSLASAVYYFSVRAKGAVSLPCACRAASQSWCHGVRKLAFPPFHVLFLSHGDVSLMCKLSKIYRLGMKDWELSKQL